MNIRINSRISARYYLAILISIYVAVVALMYFVIRGKYGVTFSPVQPDSASYLCRGFNFGNLTSADKSWYLEFISSNFRDQSQAITGCGEVPVHYKARLLLPVLIALMTKFHYAPLILFPTLVFALGSVLIWWITTRNFIISSKPLLLAIAISPWLSPHFGGHVFLVLTEGPLLFILICILSLGESRIRKDLALAAILLFSFLGITNRQSWPVIAIFAAYSVSRIFGISKFQKLFILYPFVLGLSAALNVLMPPSPSIAIKTNEIRGAVEGVIKGISGDLVHIVKFADIPGIVVLSAMAITVFKYRRAESLIPSLLLLGISLYSIGGVYLFDGSYSQNWRYFLPNGFFAIFILLKELSAMKSSATPMVD